MEDRKITLYIMGIKDTPKIVTHNFGLFKIAFNSSNIFPFLLGQILSFSVIIYYYTDFNLFYNLNDFVFRHRVQSCLKGVAYVTRYP